MQLNSSTATLAVTLLAAVSVSALSASDVAPAGSVYVPITPCRLVDTRIGEGKTGAFGPPALQANKARKIPVPTSACGVPKSLAYSATFVVVPQADKGVGWLSAWPDDKNWPGTAILNAAQGGIVDNTVNVAAGADGGIQVMANADTDLVIDLNGYYLPAPPAPQGPQGPAGPAGSSGSPGPQGLPGLEGVKGTGVGGANTFVATPANFLGISGKLNAACSAANPYPPDVKVDRRVVKLEPGTYDLGATPLDLCPNVDIEGSGEFVTTLNSTSLGQALNADFGMGELRNLKIAMSAPTASALFAKTDGWSLRHVTVEGGGILCDHATGTISYATVNARELGVSLQSCTLTIDSSTITTQNAANSRSLVLSDDSRPSSVTVRNSILNSGAGADVDIQSNATSSIVKFYGSVLLGSNLIVASKGAIDVNTTQVPANLGPDPGNHITCTLSFKPNGPDHIINADAACR